MTHPFASLDNRVWLALALLGVLVAMLPGAIGAQPPANPDLVLMVGDAQSLVSQRALAHFAEQHPEIAARHGLRLVTEAGLARLDTTNLGSAKVLIYDVHSPSPAGGRGASRKAQLVGQIAQNGRVLAVGHGALSDDAYRQLGADFDAKLRAFWDAGGWRNLYGLLCLVMQTDFGEAIEVPKMVLQPTRGYYHPQAPGDHTFSGFESYRKWLIASGRLRGTAPWVAVPFYPSTLHDEQTAVVDAVVARLEANSLNPLPVFGYPTDALWNDLVLDGAGKPRVQGAMAFNFRFASPELAQVLLESGVPIMNLIKTFARTGAEWRDSREGLSTFESVFQVAVPEMAGLVMPVVVGADKRVVDREMGVPLVVSTPIEERIDMAVRRMGRYLALQHKPNASKRVALIYYNYPPGKANIGASYLNTLRSISTILQRLQTAGYDVGTDLITEEAVSARVLAAGRNIGSYAPGELSKLARAGQVVRVPKARYQTWLDGLPPAYTQRLTTDWGEPDEKEGMWVAGENGLEAIVPAVTFGNVVLLPQPLRGFGQDLNKLYHSMDVTPPHHYDLVYRWLRDDFRADALVHVGTHGTLEWLPGKEIGLSESDAPDLMLDELPDLYVYNVDVVGEGLVARRRGMASIVDHMIPSLRKSELYGDYAEISELLSDHHGAHGKSKQLADAYGDQLRARLGALGLLEELEVAPSGGVIDHAAVHRIEDYLSELKTQNMPYGLHTFGVVPPAAERRETAQAVLEADVAASGAARRELARTLEDRIQRSGPRELDQLVAALSGRYLPVGTGNDPVRNPDSLPTGKNFFGIDPSKVPKKAAWELGVRLADQMLQQHMERTGTYPRKVAFVLWGGETIRNEGVSESQFFHLLGTRPVWDGRGKVVDVEVVPRAKLGRPRVDVVVSSAAEGMFGELTKLMDKAVQKVNLLEEPDNWVREHSLANASRLHAKGHSQREALRRASVRIFDEPPGQYNLNVARIVKSSGTWEDDGVVSNDYFQKMGHGFGNGFWGENMEDAFRLTLSGTEKVVHSASSNLYGTLDNDDFFMYAGGLVGAVRALDGTSPELLVADLRRVGQETLTPISHFMGVEFRARVTNPEWIRGMMKEGYAGAVEMRGHIDNLFGWQVTVPESVGDAKWNMVYQTYVEDREGLELQAFFEEHSAAARQDIVARLLDTIRKGYWSASTEVQERLAREYVQSAQVGGFSCSAHVCQNPSLVTYTIEMGRRAGMGEGVLDAFETAFENVSGERLGDSKRSMEAFMQATQRAHNARATRIAEGVEVEGQKLEKVEVAENPEGTSLPVDAKTERWVALAVFLFGLAGWTALRWGRRR